MRKKMKWQPEERKYIKIKCEQGIHWADYYKEFIIWRATELFDKHPDPDFKIPRTIKSISNYISCVLGYKLSEFKQVTDETIKNLERGMEPGHADYERKITAYREAMKMHRREYNKLLREINFQDRVIDVTKKFLRAMDPVFTPKPAKLITKKTKEESLLLFGDPHIGEIVNKEEMAGINEYNFDVFRLRMEYLARETIDLCMSKLSGYQFSTLNIAMLGDMVTGMIHDELIETAEGTVIEWAYGGAVIIAQFLQELAQVFEKIKVFGVVGNHGRMHKKPRFKQRYVNWDYVLYMALALMLQSQKNISFHFPKSFFIHTNINEHEFVFIHGDNIRSWMGIPFYGINRMVANFNELMASRGDYIEYFCLGHFHETGQLDKVKGEKIVNGSMIGGNEYSLGRMFTSGAPKQLLAGVHHRTGLTWRYPINLSFANLKKEPKYVFDLEKNLVDEFGRILRKSQEK